MTDHWNTKADALRDAVARLLGKPLPLNEGTGYEPVSDEAVYDFIMTGPIDYLADVAGDDFKKLSRNEQQSVVSTLVARLKSDDGIELHELGDVPVWVRVVPAVDGRLPADKPSGWRWVRLDTITEVIPNVGIGVSDDPEDWQYTLIVTAGGQQYHPTAVRFRGSAVNAPLTRLLRLVAERVAQQR
ncbi:hypothetical protein [Xanthomonas phaseoli]|uniref:hypothetical protein n=1 Tax=Xanthomonas phaseoli TaxID=1985254 RepID=UPI00035EEC36|nr:hypothetical protein [Xanthomonas phaseoli]